MVNRQMQTQGEELHSNILGMNDVLREMLADFQKLRALMEEDTREVSLWNSRLNQELTWLRIMEEEYEKTIEEDKED